MVEEQGDIQAKCDPLSSTHEHQTEEPMDGVLWHHKLTRKHREEVKPSTTISESKRVNVLFYYKNGFYIHFYCSSPAGWMQAW